MEKRKWADVLHIVSGKNQKDVQNPNGKYPIYGSGGKMGYADEYLCEPGTTIVGRKGTINRPIYVDEPFWNIDTAFGVTPDEGLDSKYLFYFCVHFNFMPLDKSTGRPSLAKSDLLKIEMPVPSIDEQRRIASRIEELVSELDNSVSTLQKTKEQLAVYRQASIKSAYPVMTKENTKKLSEISDITGGITKGRDLKQAETIFLPYLRVANVQNGFLDLTEIKEIELKADEKEKYLLKKGDVLYTEGGDRDKLGRGTVWNEEIPDCVHQNHVFRARVDKSIAIPEYVAYWSMGSYARTYFFRKGKQTVNLASINKTVLSNLELPIPDLATQEKVLAEIESRLSVCDSIEHTVDTALQQAEAMRQSILKQAFEGRL